MQQACHKSLCQALLRCCDRLSSGAQGKILHQADSVLQSIHSVTSSSCCSISATACCIALTQSKCMTQGPLQRHIDRVHLHLPTIIAVQLPFGNMLYAPGGRLTIRPCLPDADVAVARTPSLVRSCFRQERRYQAMLCSCRCNRLSRVHQLVCSLPTMLTSESMLP